MSSPATATQPAPLSQQIGFLQTFLDASLMTIKGTGDAARPLPKAELLQDGKAFRLAWEDLKAHVLCTDPIIGHLDGVGAFEQRARVFTIARRIISHSMQEKELQEKISRAVLDREGVDPFELEQHAEKGLLLIQSVSAFNFSAAQYLQKRLDDAGIKLGDFILNAARVYYSGGGGLLLGLEDSARSFLKAVESETDVVIEQQLGGLPKITVKSPKSSDFNEVYYDHFFRRTLFLWCDKALRILVAGNTQLKHKNFFELPVLVRSDIGYLQALYRAGLMDARVIGAFLTKLNIIKKRPDGLAVL